MKHPTLIAFLYLLTSCNLASLDSELVEGVITGPRTIPDTEQQIEETLHGDGKKTWNAVRFTLMGSAGFQNCRLDDQIVFNTDNSYSYNGGQLLCGAEDNSMLKSGTWFARDNQLMFFENEQRQYAAQILGLVQDTLVVRGTYLGLEIKGLYISN